MPLMKKNKQFKENEDYVFCNIEEQDLTAIRLTSGKFKDVIYCYGKAQIEEQGELAVLKFDFIVIDSASFSVDELTQSEEFNTIMGDLLSQFIMKEEVYGQT
jgi:hypothetical protein